ncbi:phosphotriesterase [Pedobacter sp. HMF7647]|uniref:Phosphotriesterase n=1 Tax=Hufsiella arboris TaxID=2695275 RepID=A0A7K1YF77_9SPHI|nr:phosphotriesterase [Hufsiella arboris]MXV53070.1 phosphotriesterase [Hufsiella arboris]
MFLLSVEKAWWVSYKKVLLVSDALKTQSMLNRRTFIKQSLVAGASLYIAPRNLLAAQKQPVIMTVKGPLQLTEMKFTLTHEHVLADFIGAEKYSKDRYNSDEVFDRALPFLLDVKKRGCSTFVDCSPAFLGRDVKLLKRLADASGLQIITNTGYYGAVNEKFLPKFVYSETAEQIAARWINEWQNGIDGTDIKPGFLKTSVDKAPLTPTQRKIIEAAALTHLATGLTIAIHTGNGDAALEHFSILTSKGVSPTARIWVHAQNESDKKYHVEAAKNKSWVSFDGVNPETIRVNLDYLQSMKDNGLLNHVLVSQDSGWYHVGEPNGGNYKNYNCIIDQFIPALKKQGFSQQEINQLFISNPAEAFAIRFRKN